MAHLDHSWMTDPTGFPLMGTLEFEFLDAEGWHVDLVTRFTIYTSPVSTSVRMGEGPYFGFVGTFRLDQTFPFPIGLPEPMMPPMPQMIQVPVPVPVPVPVQGPVPIQDDHGPEQVVPDIDLVPLLEIHEVPDVRHARQESSRQYSRHSSVYQRLL